MPRFMKLLLAAIVTLGVLSGLSFVAATAANACSQYDADHCYGTAQVYTGSTVKGIMSYETLNCTMTVPLYNFETDEIWLDGQASDTNWLEVGYTYTNQGNLGGVPGTQFATFWASERSGRYSSTVLNKNPAMSGNFYIQPHSAINGYDLGFTSSLGYNHQHQVKNDTLSPLAAAFGSETTANSGHAGFNGSPSWEDAGGNWIGGTNGAVTITRNAPNRFSWQSSQHFNYTSGPSC